MVTRVGAKVGQSGVAAGSSVLCGPAFGLCASGMFLGTWLLSDLLINKVDETLHRDALRASLLAELEQEKQRLKAEYSAVFAQGLSQLRLAMDGEREQRFEILRDGLGREKSQS